MQKELKKPDMLEFTKDLAVAVADFYEYSMAEANIIEGIKGRESVFDVVVRRTPTNKVVGHFEHEGVKYEKLEKRNFLINAGLEQCAAYFLEGKGTKQLRNYMENIQGVNDLEFLDWVENIEFKGDVYGMKEGTVFFPQEQQIRIHERFEEAQVYESLMLCTTNPQTNVATVANDIASVADKILLEGGSRRATSPQSSMFNSRAAKIGGFTASSNVAHGMKNNMKVGGTHGHSYVMLHAEEYDAFKAQVKTFGDDVCFLLDTYNVKNALEEVLDIVEKENLNHFAFRIDSGDLGEQAKYIHELMKEEGFERNKYTLVASDDLTTEKIKVLEESGADIDKYLVGTYVVNPPKPVTGVYKLAAFKEEKEWNLRGKLSEEFTKATLPGIKQIYRVEGTDGFYKKDIIAFENEDIGKYLDEGDRVEELLVPIIQQGKQVYDFPELNEISDYRKEQLAKFKDTKNYEVIISDGVMDAQREIMHKHGLLKKEMEFN